MTCEIYFEVQYGIKSMVMGSDDAFGVKGLATPSDFGAKGHERIKGCDLSIIDCFDQKIII